MYLKTYAKFTFSIKSQGHIYDENFLYYCMDLAKGKLLLTVSEDKKIYFYLLNFFRYVPQNIHGHFQSYFQNGCTQSSEATFGFCCIKLSHQCCICCKLTFIPNSSTLQN